MNILLCNDDGIYAPGIWELYQAVKDLGTIHVVAPHAERSAVGHAITVSNPIKISKAYRNDTFFGHAVEGTPADCVKLAVFHLLDQKPDLVLSGINLGQNAGISVIYSGTVSAATEGTILGIPSIAISLNTYTDPHWSTAAKAARYLTQEVAKSGLPSHTLMNVNVPNLPEDQINGYEITKMGPSHYVDYFDQRTDPRGNTYFWMGGDIKQTGDTKGTDLEALKNGYVSISPIYYDLTNYQALPELEKWKLEWEVNGK